MQKKDKQIIILLGAPGSGKTTVGEKLQKVLSNSFFASVGNVMRIEMKLTPPFSGVDRKKVMQFIYDAYVHSNSDTLIIDCNPFPDQTREACGAVADLFEKVLYVHICAPDEILLQRMRCRNRNDSPTFTDEQRLEYFHANVDKPISDVLRQNNSISVSNINTKDIDDIVQLVQSEIMK